MRYVKNIIIAARVMSMVFTPFYLPTVALLALFSFSYLSLLPFMYKTFVIAIVYFFTILLPTLLIHIYRRYQHWNLIELGHRDGHQDEQRIQHQLLPPILLPQYLAPHPHDGP